MIRRRSVAVTFGLCALACSGRYVSGGTHDDPAPPGSSGSGGDVDVMPPLGTGGTMAVAGGANVPEPSCIPEGEPAALAGPFASPDVVWQRVAPLAWGRDVPPPSLPAQSTYEWAGNIALQALDQAWAASQAASSPDAIPGPRWFLRRWIHLGDDASLSPNWNQLLVSEEPALQALLTAPLVPGQRFGIFSEPDWLVAHSYISARGAVLSEALFGMQVPPPPVGFPPPEPPADGLTRRERLERQVTAAPCAGCHTVFDPLGVSLEHFDADGNFTMLDAGKPVDSSGSYRLPSQDAVARYVDNLDLGRQLVFSCDATRGLVGQFLRIASEKAGTPVEARDMVLEQNHVRIEQAFVNGGRTYRALLKAYAQSPAALRP
jgi:hypothetical protein